MAGNGTRPPGAGGSRRSWLAGGLSVLLVAGLATVATGNQVRRAAEPPLTAPAPEFALVEGSGDEPAAPDTAHALLAAASLDQAVEIAELTTEQVRHLALPSGTVRFESYAVPQRVWRDDRWVPVDATLRRAGDRVAPAATSLDISFSAGGDREVVRAAEGDRWLALSWPAPLPEPVLSGDTAIYPEVLPGVDLVLRADVESFAQVLKVKTREAAANPELARLGWDVSVAGLVLELADDGAVAAWDPVTGELVLVAPPATMWDSPVNVGDDWDGLSGDQEPGRLQVIPTELADDQLVVLPDLDMLAEPQTQFPVYIDPSFARGQQNWATVSKQNPSSGWTSDSNWPRSEGLRVGFCNWNGCLSGSSAHGVWRGVMRFSIDGLAGRHVVSSKVHMAQTHTGGCEEYYVQLWRVSAFTNGVSWNGVNWMYDDYLQRRQVKSSNSTGGCGSVLPIRNFNFSNSNVRSRVQSAANNSNSTISFGVRSNNETSRNQWRKIHRDSLVLEVEYDAYPNTPTNVTIAGGDADCHGSCSSPATVRVLRPYLQGRVSKSFSGNVRAEFQLRNVATGAVVATHTTSAKSTPSTFQWRAPSGLSNGEEYRFRVRGVNSAGGTGPWSSYFRFTINTAGPGVPTQLGIDSTGDCFGACESPAMLNSRRPVFRATPQHPMGDDTAAVFEVWSEDASTLVAAGTVSNAPPGVKATWQPPSNLPQEQAMRLRVRSTGDKLGRSGSWSSWFTFTVDTAAPNLPSVSSPLYAHKDTGTWNGGVGQAGVFHFGPNGSGDVVTYQWRLNGGGVASATVAKGGGHTVSLTPPGDLEQLLEVRTIDHAGNTSPWRAYPFYVRPQPADAGYWKFDEGSGSTAASSVPGGEGFAGQLAGGASWAASGINPGNPGASGMAVSLDGSSAYVEMPPVLATNHAAGFTVSAWVNPTSLSGDRTVVAQRGDDTYMFRLSYRSASDQWCFEVRHSDSPTASATRACSGISPQTGVWTHLVGVYDNPAGKLRLWVNGGPNNGLPVAGDVTEETAPAAWASTGSFEVGRAFTSAYFAGRVDEVRAYQRVVTEIETVTMFRSCLDESCPPVPQPADLMLVGGWDFEETTGSVAAGGSQLGNHATRSGGAEWTAFGYRDTRGVWIDAQDGYLATSGPVVLTDQSFTVSAWVRLDQKSGTEQWVVQVPGVDAPALKLFYHPGVDAWRLVVSFHDGGSATTYTVTAGAAVEVGQWTHLVGVYDAPGGALRLYVDGQLDDDEVGVAVQPGTGDLHLGGGPAGGQLRGTLDLVRAFQGAASGTQVGQWYAEQLAPPPAAQPPQLLGDWRMDDGAGAAAFDHTWLGNDGTLSGGATWPAGGEAYAGQYGVSFDGSSGQVQTWWPPILTDQAFTVSAWVRLESTGVDRTAVAIDGASGLPFELGYLGGSYCFRMYDQDQPGAGTSTACASGSPAVGVWTHLVGVFDKRDRSLWLYVDGVAAGSATYAGLDPWQATGPLVIGRGQAGGSPQRWWSGGVALVRTYQGAMGEEGVADLYEQQVDDTPAAVIQTPTGAGLWTAGQQVSFTGLGSDAAGELPASALHWELMVRACDDPQACEADLLQTWPAVAGGSFQAPDVAEPVWLELRLTVDNGTATASTTVELAPATVALTFEADPDGLELTVGGATAETPFTVEVVQGASVPVAAPSPQERDDPQQQDGVTYLFDSWAHGGDASQHLVAPTTPATYLATFAEESLEEAPTDSYEAEDSGNTLGGAAQVALLAGASGGSVVTGLGDGDGNFLQFNDVTVAVAQVAALTVLYVAEEDQPVTMRINGGDPIELLFPGSGDVDVVDELTFGIELAAGVNTIRFSDPTEVAPDFDRIVVDLDPVDPPPPPMPGASYEAEAAGNTLGGTATAAPLAGASGGSVVTSIGGGNANFLQFNDIMVNQAQQVALTVHYTTEADRPVTMSVNGGDPVMLVFPGTGDPAEVGELTFGVDLAAGANTIRFTHPLADAPDLDRIVVDTYAINPPAPRVNLAWNRPVWDNSACSGSTGAEKAVNGSWTGGTNDRWCGYDHPPYWLARWFWVDLGSVMPIGNITIRHAGAGGESADLNTRDFLVKVSDDGLNWITAVEVAGNTADVTSHDVTTSGRYVRLDVVTPSSNGDEDARIYQLEVYADPVGEPPPPPVQPNLAWGRPVRADSACSGLEQPENAVNGSWTADDPWCSDTNPPYTHSRWLQVDLGEVVPIGNITIRHAGVGGWDPGYNTRDFLIKVSDDDRNWITVADVAGNTADVTSHDVTAGGRYVRLDVVTPSSNGATEAWIYQLEVYSDSVGVPPAPPAAEEPAGNLAWGKEAWSTSPCGGFEGPENAVNGSWTADDPWCSATNPPYTHSRWLQVDLGEVVPIGNITIRHAGAGGLDPVGNTRDFVVKVSDNNLHWRTVVEVTGNTADVTSHEVAASGRYVRLDVLTPASDAGEDALIYHLEVYSDSVGVPPAPPAAEEPAGNLAWGKEAWSTSPCGGFEGPENAVNGDWFAVFPWCSATNPPYTHSRWLQVDLGEVEDIGSFTVRHAGAGGEDPTLNTRDFTISVSDDGSSWATVVVVTGNTADVTIHGVTTSGRFVRLDVQTPTSTSDDAARIYHFEVYGDE